VPDAPAVRSVARRPLAAPTQFHHIRHMPNIQNKPQNKPLSKTQHAFIDDIAALFMHWGMPQTEACLYGYLLLSAKPVSLDRIVDDLAMSKSSASVAARALESYRVARKHRVRGSKRVLYEASTDFGGRLARQSALLGSLGQMISERTPTVASGAAASRLQILAEFYRAMSEAMEQQIRELNDKLAKQNA
jgi:DNA-binding transcriptional regulator GbsR (MarR family)